MDQMENYCDKMSTTAGLAGPIYSPISSLPKQFDRNNIKLICCDIDGTTLNSNHQLTPYTMDTFRQIRARHSGIQMIFATGRPRSATQTVRAAMEELGHAGGIYLNGAICGVEDATSTEGGRDPQFRAKHEILISPDDALWYLDYAVIHDYPIIIYSKDLIFTPKDNEVFRITADADEPYPILMGLPELTAGIASASIVVHKLGFLARSTQLDETRIGLEAASQRPSVTTALLRTGVERLEVISSSASKASALTVYVKDVVGCTMDQVIAFGDGENDIEMIRDVGMGVAMGNACPEAKDIANYVAPSCDEDGLARVLRTIFQLDLPVSPA